MSHVLTILKLIAFGVLGVLGAVLVVVLIAVLAPFVTAYFLFDRLCSLIEEFKPQRKKKSRGGRLANIQKFLALIPSKRV